MSNKIWGLPTLQPRAFSNFTAGKNSFFQADGGRKVTQHYNCNDLLHHYTKLMREFHSIEDAKRASSSKHAVDLANRINALAIAMKEHGCGDYAMVSLMSGIGGGGPASTGGGGHPGGGGEGRPYLPATGGGCGCAGDNMRNFTGIPQPFDQINTATYEWNDSVFSAGPFKKDAFANPNIDTFQQAVAMTVMPMPDAPVAAIPATGVTPLPTDAATIPDPAYAKPTFLRWVLNGFRV